MHQQIDKTYDMQFLLKQLCTGTHIINILQFFPHLWKPSITFCRLTLQTWLTKGDTHKFIDDMFCFFKTWMGVKIRKYVSPFYNALSMDILE